MRFPGQVFRKFLKKIPEKNDFKHGENQWKLLNITYKLCKLTTSSWKIFYQNHEKKIPTLQSFKRKGPYKCIVRLLKDRPRGAQSRYELWISGYLIAEDIQTHYVGV